MVEALVRDVPSLADHEIRARLDALAAAIGDSHTALDGWGASPTTFPFAAYELADGVFVTRAAPGYEHLLGRELRAIEVFPLAEARARAATLIAHENDARLSLLAPRVYANPDLLHVLGIARSRAAASFTFGDEAVSLPAIPSDRSTWISAAAEVPFYRQRADEPFWSAELGGGEVLYVKYNDCRHIRRFGRFARGVLRRLDAGGVRRVVIDFRGNGGGNSLQFDYMLLRGLARRRVASLYGLTDRATFSSAMLNAAQLRSQAGAVLVGEPTGGKPNCYAEVRRLRLPNSALSVAYSTRFIESAPDLGDAPSLDPDVRVPLTSHDWLRGRDPILDEVLA
ncbi:MAG TPA: hypothetical protein VJT67_10935, partial [Longimicrobiaceae bacterium]|nr:hypothetical protein [Longimicrobiaceae bacterium]